MGGSTELQMITLTPLSLERITEPLALLLDGVLQGLLPNAKVLESGQSEAPLVSPHGATGRNDAWGSSTQTSDLTMRFSTTPFSLNP